MVIRNAIGLVTGHGGDSFVSTNDGVDNGLFAFCPDNSPASIDEYEAILELPECDRFVFVICVLERYSTQDCALLLGKPLRDIDEARQRVGNQAGQIDELSDLSQRFAMRWPGVFPAEEPMNTTCYDPRDAFPEMVEDTTGNSSNAEIYDH